MSNHEGIRAMTEDQAAELFALPEVLQTANEVREHLSQHLVHGGKAKDGQRLAGRHWLEAEAMLQSEGGRLHKVQGNRHHAEALLHTHNAEMAAVDAEQAWAELAQRHQCYVPHGRRLEVRMAERPNDNYVYCWDADHLEMGWHHMDDCDPGAALRHAHPENLLRTWDNATQSLVALPGRKGLP